jgi:hypothetical protein
MNAVCAVCPLHGPTTVIRTNAYGFPVYACCCDDVQPVNADACTRAPTPRGTEPQRRQEQPGKQRE